jgi:hypothetical protein
MLPLHAPILKLIANNGLLKLGVAVVHISVMMITALHCRPEKQYSFQFPLELRNTLHLPDTAALQ